MNSFSVLIDHIFNSSVIYSTCKALLFDIIAHYVLHITNSPYLQQTLIKWQKHCGSLIQILKIYVNKINFYNPCWHGI